jgi:enterochelin esterase-like enzyme
VYTPPGYDQTSRKKYPVIYLLHGLSDDTTVWIGAGRANVILDNLIPRSHAKPMIVVMPLGYGTREILTNRNATVMKRNLELFRDALLNEVMPAAEKAYRICANRKTRAIAGLSMGGAESLFSGLNSLDRFASVGAFSSGGLSTDFPSVFPTLDEKANRQLQLLWISCGTTDGLIGANRNLDRWLTSKMVHHTFVEMPGPHSFRAWRRSLIEFTKLVFNPANDRDR